MVAVVVLSAGGSRRFGGSPKALLSAGPETFLDRVVRTSAGLGLAPIVVVVGSHGREVRAGVQPSTAQSVEWVENPAWELGRTGSAQAGLAVLSDGADSFLWPVDTPFAKPATLERLLDVFARDQVGVWFVPTHEDRGGHPVLLRAPAIRLILGQPPDRPLRSMLPELGPQVVRVPVPDPGVTRNMNTPGEYHEGMAATAADVSDRWTER